MLQWRIKPVRSTFSESRHLDFRNFFHAGGRQNCSLELGHAVKLHLKSYLPHQRNDMKETNLNVSRSLQQWLEAGSSSSMIDSWPSMDEKHQNPKETTCETVKHPIKKTRVKDSHILMKSVSLLTPFHNTHSMLPLLAGLWSGCFRRQIGGHLWAHLGRDALELLEKAHHSPALSHVSYCTGLELLRETPCL